MKKILLVLSFLLTLIISFDLFLKEPPVWPDEASLAFFATDQTNVFQLYKNYPSIYVPILAGWFSVTGISIESQRILSVLIGFGCVAIFILLVNKFSKDYIKNNSYKLLPIILLVTDFTFLQASRVGRPEIFVLFFGLFSIHLYLYYLNNYRLIYLFLSLFLGLVSALFHPNGLIFLISIFLSTRILFKKLPKLHHEITKICALFFVGFTVLILTLTPVAKSFLNRLNISDLNSSWLFTVFGSKPLELKILYFSFIVITILYMKFILSNKNLKNYIYIIPSIFSWIVLLFNKDFWYAVYIIPFVYLCLWLLVENYFDAVSKNKLYFLLMVTSAIFLSNLLFHLKILLNEGGERYSYQNFIREIAQIIPDNKSVYTSAIPDPYYAFTSKKNIKLLRFPQSPISKDNFLQELNKVDFIVYNGPFGSNFYGDSIIDYIKSNTQKTTEIGEDGQYRAVIIELKPTDIRKNP